LLTFRFVLRGAQPVIASISLRELDLKQKMIGMSGADNKSLSFEN
jgi:hypothetical protein